MPTNRKEVETYWRQEKEKAEAALAPIRERILDVLSDDPENLHSGDELFALFATVPPFVPGAELAPAEQKDLQTQMEEVQRTGALFNEAINTLLQEKKIVVFMAVPPEQAYLFGLASQDSLKIEKTMTGGCGDACNCHS